MAKPCSSDRMIENVRLSLASRKNKLEDSKCGYTLEDQKSLIQHNTEVERKREYTLNFVGHFVPTQIVRFVTLFFFSLLFMSYAKESAVYLNKSQYTDL